MDTSYYNTTNLKGSDLYRRIYQAEKQEDKVLAFFKYQEHMHPGSVWSPFEVLKLVFAETVPVTSVRRSITNLTKAGYLVKTTFKVMGPYGMPSYTWRLNK